MRLSTQFKIILVTFSIVLVIVASLWVVTADEITRTRTQETLANNVVQGASELSYLASDYVIYRENQQLERWQERYNLFSTDINSLSAETSEQQALVRNVRLSAQNMKEVFDSIVSSIENIENQDITMEALQLSWSRMTIQSQTMITDASRLAELMRVKVDELNMLNFVGVFAIIVAFGALLGAIYLQSFRRTLKSIVDLEAGAAIIGSGNMDFKLKENRKDEIGHLSMAFNEMTAKLKTVTASKSDLEREIEERKKAQEALQDTEQRMRFALESTNIGTWDLDLVDQTAFRSLEHDRIFGYSELLPNWTVNDFLKHALPEYREEVKTMVQEATVAKRGWTYQCQIRRVDGEIRWIWFSGRYYIAPSGHSRVAGIVQDITERIKAENALMKYQEKLEALVEERTKKLKDAERLAAIGATAGMVGHDIRNPLQAITSDVYLAKTELASLPSSEEKKNALESMEEMEKNIDYINKIVQDLQDYARPLNPKIEESDLRSLVETIIRKNGVPSNIKVHVKISDESLKVRADSYYLNRILTNLVTNAVQAMPNGGNLIIDAHKEENDTILSVKDTGIGIPQEIQDKMFTLMFTTKSKGQGFGLPVVKRMTESLGGTATFESQAGKGTTFTVRLPPTKS
jgi:PAS domain S-box-containing protein